MPHRDAPDICRKIDAALDVISENGDEMRPYLLYQLEQMMGGPKHITLDDCMTSELMSLAALLAPVLSRRLAGLGTPTEEGFGNRVLRLVVNRPAGA